MINRTIAVFKSMGTITRCCVCFKRHMGSVAHFAYMFCMSFDIVLLAQTTCALRLCYDSCANSLRSHCSPFFSFPRTMEHRLNALAITSSGVHFFLSFRVTFIFPWDFPTCQSRLTSSLPTLSFMR